MKKLQLLMGSTFIAVLLVMGFLILSDNSVVASESSVTLEFNANSVDGFGKEIYTENDFDLLVTLWPHEIITSEVQIIFRNVVPNWEGHQAEGLSGIWSEGDGEKIWSGYFLESGPIEIWVHGINSFYGLREFPLEVIVNDSSYHEMVTVINPNWIEVDYNVNSPDDFGEIITTTIFTDFDLLAVLWPHTEITDTVVVVFQNVNPNWIGYQAEGLNGIWNSADDWVTWTGNFPEEGPVEIWLHAINNLCGEITFPLEVNASTGNASEQVTVISTCYRVNMPYVTK